MFLLAHQRENRNVFVVDLDAELHVYYCAFSLWNEYKNSKIKGFYRSLFELVARQPFF